MTWNSELVKKIEEKLRSLLLADSIGEEEKLRIVEKVIQLINADRQILPRKRVIVR